MEHNGWIKLHRKLLDKGYWDRSQYVHLWLHLLLSANHKPKEYMTNGNIILIKEGQLLTGRKQLSLATGIPQTTIEDILKVFEKEQQIRQQKTTKYRLITILHWKEYQESDIKPTSSRHQADTNKNERMKESSSEASLSQEKVYEPEESQPKRVSTAKYPHSKEVFSWFPKDVYEESWKLNTTILKHSELLYLRGEKAVRGIIKFCRANESDAFFPVWNDPTSLERNWNKIIKFADRNGL